MDLEKFIPRVENMVYHICGCNFEEAQVLLSACLDNARNKELFKRKKRTKKEIREFNDWINYIKIHSDQECGEIHNKKANEEMRKSQGSNKNQNIN